MKKGAKIIEVKGSNFKGLHEIRITPIPGSRVIQITGGNGAGKTSVQDLIRFLLAGKKALPLDKRSVIRNGAKDMQGSIRIAGEEVEFMVTRGINRESGEPTVAIDVVKGKRDLTSQKFLDSFLGELTFDPLYFAHLPEIENNRDRGREMQIAILRKASKVTVDFEAIDKANEDDYKERAAIKLEIKMIEGHRQGLNVLDGLPPQKLDEDAILARLNAAGEMNRKAQQIFQVRQELGAAAARIGAEKAETERRIQAKDAEIERLKGLLETAQRERKQMQADAKDVAARWKKAEADFEAAPAGEPVDVTALTMELQSVQRTNRAIDTRTQWQQLSDQIDAKQKKVDALTRQMDARDEKKTQAVANAKMPVEGLTFDATKIEYQGRLLENLSEGEQIKISTLIGMAMNPKLRVMFIRNGEALDDAGLKMMEQLAEEHDFQIWMARVESSGKVGFFMEGGWVAAANEDVTA